MSKLNRLTAKIFGETASTTNTPKEIGQFGSAKAGTYNATGDVAAIQSLPAWSNGWIGAVTPTDQFPPLPEMTGVHKVLSYQNAYLLQQGIPEWDSATTYYKNGFCTYNGIVYRSILDENIDNQPNEAPDAWFEYGSGDYANQDINNLTTFGNARLQYTPFAINVGTVINGNNNTLQSGSFTKSYTSAGTYAIEITEAGNYEVEMYGAGGGAANGTFITDVNYCATYGGASGAGFKGTLNLAVGSYNIIVGKAGQSNLSKTANQTHTGTSGTNTSFAGITASGGTGATSNGHAGNGGTGGSVTITDSSIVVSTTLNKSGYSGSRAGAGTNAGPVAVSGGVSVYDNTHTGYGAGAGVNSSKNEIKAQDGFFKITKLSGDASKIFCDPCTITTCDGRTTSFDTNASFDATGYNGTYFVFKDCESGDLSLVANSLFEMSKTAPTTSSNKHWLDVSTVPANLRVYNSETQNWDVANNLVCIGKCTVSAGTVTDINNYQFNNGWKLDKVSIVESYRSSYSYYIVYSNGECVQGGRVLRTGNTQTVSFLKPFTNSTTIQILISVACTTENKDGRPPLINSRTTSSFVVNVYTDDYTTIFWQARGKVTV